MIRFGISGLGRIGKRHADAITSVSGAELVGVADPAVSDFEGLVAYDSVSEMTEACDPDVVCICTPNHLHAAQTMEALRNGCHVICEKPLTLSHREAVELLQTATRRDLLLACVLQNRYSPQVRWLKQIVESGRLGEIIQVQVNCFWNRDDRYFMSSDGERHPWHGRAGKDGGPLFTQFSHFVDLLIWLFGSFEVANGEFANFTHKHSVDYEDTGKFDILLPNGGFGVFQYTIAVWDRNQESSITLVGTSGSVKLGGQYMNSLEYGHFEGFQHPDFETSVPVNNHARVVKNVVEVLKGTSEALHFDIQDAIEGVRIIENVYRMRNISSQTS